MSYNPFVKKKPIIQQVYEVVTPIFTPEMGKRLMFMRMRLLLDQRQLAAKLGTQQQIISKLERGLQATICAPFSVAKMHEVFGDTILHILLGTGEDRFNYGHIHDKYWTEKNKTRGFGTTKRGTSLEARLKNDV